MKIDQRQALGRLCRCGPLQRDGEGLYRLQLRPAREALAG